MDIKRTLLWVLFTLSLVMLYDSWQRANGHGTLFSPAPATVASSVTAAKNDLPSLTPSPATSAPVAVPLVQGERVTVNTDVLRAQVDTLGGSLVKLELLKHINSDGKPLVLFDRSATHTYVARSGLIGAGELPNHTLQFSVAAGERDLGQGDRVTLRLEGEKNGVKLLKTYIFKRGSYVIDTGFEVQNTSQAAVSPTLYMELLRDDSVIDASRFYSTFTGPAVYSDVEKYQKVNFEDITKNKAKYVSGFKKGEEGWVSMVQHYFASAWVADTKVEREVYANQVEAHLFRVGLKQNLGTVAPGASVSTQARLFAGPQEERVLEVVAPGLELVKDYGWLTMIAKPLFWLLEKIHALVSNWGWSIILLTVLIKLAFFPLSASSYKSMAKMKDLQPRLLALRERYKDEPQKLNQEMMQMYRTEKVNPLGGCLPILIQIPVFIALYWVLLSSVEMRNAPWLGWIGDLSKPDPLYILPILMAVSMFVQTKLNPTPPDPMQAKVMMIMPLVFSVMFFFFPSGLVLYWVVNNVLSIAQQWQINRMMGNHHHHHHKKTD
jgi:YidC/Oxa1 family membrane protein insertase